MMERFSDAKEIQHNKFADSPLGKSCKNIDLNKSPILEYKSLAIICDIYSHCPIENGDWTGKRGNSKWIPNEVYIPKKSNPEEKSYLAKGGKETKISKKYKDSIDEFMGA